MKKHVFIAYVVALFLSNSAMADPAKESGFYVGGAVGVTELDDDGAFSFLQFDDSDSSFILHGGYKFLPYFALEGRVGDLGSYTVSDGFFTEKISVDIVSVHAVGIIPFGQSSWELFGQLGLGSADINCFGCSDETVGSAGLGVRYSPTEHIGIGLQLDAYAYEDDSLGFQTYDIAVGSTQLSFQYLF